MDFKSLKVSFILTRSKTFLILEHFYCLLYLQCYLVPLTVSIFVLGGGSTSHMWKPVVDITSIRFLPLLLPVISCWIRNLQIQLDWLARKHLELICLHLSILRLQMHINNLLGGTKIWTQVFMFAHSHFTYHAVSLALFFFPTFKIRLHFLFVPLPLYFFPSLFSLGLFFLPFLLLFPLMLSSLVYFVLFFKYKPRNCYFVFLHCYFVFIHDSV